MVLKCFTFLNKMKIGIIGGSGLDDPKLLEDYKEIEVETPYGKPSSPLVVGKIKDVEVVILSRHGKKHEFPPTHVNNRANIFALKEQGCKYILATTAVGSLKQEIKRGDFVIVDQFIDFTKQRKLSFFDKFEFGPVHVSMANPFSKNLRERLINSCKALGYAHHENGTIITIEGSRFSTMAESNMFRLLGAELVNMSTAPEATLAMEAGIEYAVIAMSTDYDCWKQDEEPVTWEIISEIMDKNAQRVKEILVKTVESFSKLTDCDTEKFNEFRGAQEPLEFSPRVLDTIKSKIRTIPNFPKQGIMFRDLTTLFKDREGMKKTVEIIYNRYKDRNIELVAGIESRGFILGGIIADKLNIGFVPIRKKGKLPGETEGQEYELEYGKDVVEIHKDAIQPGQRVLLVDDLIATSGTMLASCNLIKKLGGIIVECATIVELEDLCGREKLGKFGYELFSLVKFKESEL